MALAAPTYAPSQPSLQRTLALIKPDACGQPWIETYVTKAPVPEDQDEADAAKDDKWEISTEMRAPDKAVEIIARINKAGFAIVQQRLMHLSKSEAEEFYAEHAGKHFYDKLSGFMSSGPTLALVLEKENAIADWRTLMGPTNSIQAKEAAEAAHPLNEDSWSIRATYGTDGTKNATHGSDSTVSADREIRFFFPELSAFERAAVVVLPHAVEAGHCDKIVEDLEDNEFFVLARKVIAVPEELARWLANDDANTAAAIHQGAAELIVVERKQATTKLRALVGPTPSIARANAHRSFRARFGVDDSQIGVTFATAGALTTALIECVFPTGLPAQKTLCVIKPGTANIHYSAIIHDILAAGFTVIAETRRRLAKEEVEEFYGEHKGKSFFDGLVTYMCSAPVVALALSKPNAIKCWRQLMGPTNTFTARREKPSSLRAKYGVDGTQNATHGSDSVESASRELRFYFPHLIADQTLSGQAAVQYLKSTVITQVYDSTREAIVPKTLDAVVVDALAALAKAKPSSSPLEAIRWLGQWLVDNNPRHGTMAPLARSYAVVEPDDEGQVHMQKPTRAVTHVQASAGASNASGKPSRSLGVKSTIVFILGGPGSGKGTQCERIASKFGYTHLSTGDLLRAELKSGSELGKELGPIMASGGLVGDDIALRLLKEAMEKSKSCKFLIDGYPRSLTQALEFERVVGTPTFVVAFEAAESVLEERLLARGKSSGRADDADVTAIRARFKTFVEQSAPVIDFYDKLGIVKRINSERTVEEVLLKTEPHFLPQLLWIAGGPASGKLTLATALAGANLGFHLLSVKDLLQAEIASGSAFGSELADAQGRGIAMTTQQLLQLLREEIARQGCTARYVMNGAPRNQEDATAIIAEFGEPLGVLQLAAPDAILVERFVARRASASVAGTHKARLTALKHITHFRLELGAVLSALAKKALVHTIDASLHMDAVLTAARRVLQPEYVFVLGGPGVGKGTQCARIAQTFGFIHVSAGDLLRAEVARKSKHGQLISSYLVEGKIVPMGITIDLLRAAIIGSRGTKFLIDGFPRESGQAAAFEESIGLPSSVLFFDAPEVVLKSRLLARAVSSGRSDDNEITIEKRFSTFRTQSVPVVARYAASGVLHVIDSSPTPEDVFKTVSNLFKRSVVAVIGLPGCGKKVQCDNMVRELGFTQISSEDLLRAEITLGSPLGTELKRAMADGAVVSDDVKHQLLLKAITSSSSRKVLLTGYPTSLRQAELLERDLGMPSVVLKLDGSRDVFKARLLKLAKAASRAEETESLISKRFASFEEQYAPVVARYTAAKIVRTIDACPQPEIVFSSIKPFFQPQIAFLVAAVGSGRNELALRAGKLLGYCTLRVPSLLQVEARSGSAAGAVIADAFARKATVPVETALAVIQKAILSSSCTRFLLEGFPRTVTHGFPSVHDQVFAVEAKLGVVRGCVCLDTETQVRLHRAGSKTPGEVAIVQRKVQTFQREKVPVLTFFQKIGKATVIDTSTISPDAVFEAARPFLE
jgi:adenylate kinase